MMTSYISIDISLTSLGIACIVFTISYLRLMSIFKKLGINRFFASLMSSSKVDKKIMKSTASFSIKAPKLNFLLDDIVRRNNDVLKIRLLRWAWLAINAGLMLSVITLIEGEEPENEKDDHRNRKIDTNTVIGMLVGEKIKKDTKSYLVLFMALALSVFLPTLDLYIFNPYVTALFAMLICFMAISHKLLEYRISNGFYGSNSYEAKEIILFIQNKLSDDDFDGFGKREVFQEKDVKAKSHKDELGGVTE